MECEQTIPCQREKCNCDANRISSAEKEMRVGTSVNPSKYSV